MLAKSQREFPFNDVPAHFRARMRRLLIAPMHTIYDINLWGPSPPSSSALGNNSSLTMESSTAPLGSVSNGEADGLQDWAHPWEWLEDAPVPSVPLFLFKASRLSRRDCAYSVQMKLGIARSGAKLKKTDDALLIFGCREGMPFPVTKNSAPLESGSTPTPSFSPAAAATPKEASASVAGNLKAKGKLGAPTEKGKNPTSSLLGHSMGMPSEGGGNKRPFAGGPQSEAKRAKPDSTTKKM
jgi:hypothetical protein